MTTCPICEIEYIEGQEKSCSNCGWDILVEGDQTTERIKPDLRQRAKELFQLSQDVQTNREQFEQTKSVFVSKLQQQRFQFELEQSVFIEKLSHSLQLPSPKEKSSGNSLESENKTTWSEPKQRPEVRWAPIVWGRTYQVDYHLLAIPDSFEPEDEKWVLKHIYVTSRNLKLGDEPRRILFKNERYLIMGISCMVKDLFGNPKAERLQKFCSDEHKRALFTFSGYVAKIDFNEIPLYEVLHFFDNPLPLKSFQALYLEIFEPLWLKKDYQLKKSQLYEYRIKMPTVSPYYKLYGHDKFNEDTETLSVWQDTQLNRKLLAYGACSLMNENPASKVNLCLGMSKAEDAQKGPFFTVTARKMDDKQKEPIRITKPKSSKTSSDRFSPSPQKLYSSKETNEIMKSFNVTTGAKNNTNQSRYTNKIPQKKTKENFNHSHQESKKRNWKKILFSSLVSFLIMVLSFYANIYFPKGFIVLVFFVLIAGILMGNFFPSKEKYSSRQDD